MANREENLKKINAELEKLDDEQLEKVAGGTSDEYLTPPMVNTPIGRMTVKEADEWLKRNMNIDATKKFMK